VDGRAARLGLRRAIGLGVLADAAGQPPQRLVGLGVVGREEEAEQVGAERAARVAPPPLVDRGLAAQHPTRLTGAVK